MINQIAKKIADLKHRRFINTGLRTVCAVAVIIGTAIMIPAIPVSAASVSWDGEAGDGLWSNPVNWSGDTLPQPEDIITISGSAGEVILDVDFTLTGILTVSGIGNTLRISTGVTLTMNPDLPPGQYDKITLDNGATLVNDGIITGTSTSPLPRIYVTSTGSVTNNGAINTAGVFLRGGPQYPPLNNYGSMLTVRVSTLVGEVNNYGIIDDAQLNFQFGAINNTAVGIINTTPTLSTIGSRFLNTTVFENHGIMTNTGDIDNEGVFDNYGSFDNAGTFINTCDFVNGIVGIFNNYGTFTGNPVLYEGSIFDNDSGDSLWSNPLNWSSDVLPAPANDIIINNIGEADTTLIIDVNIVIDGKVGLRNSFGPPTVTTLEVQTGVTLTNNGEITFSSDTCINNQGTITNNGDIRASGTAVYTGSGSYTGNPIIGLSSIWDGEAGDGLWSNPLNWERDSVPGTGDYVTMSGSAGDVLLDIDFTVMGKITVNGAGNTLIITPGVTLTLDPDLAPGQYDTILIGNDASLVNNGTVAGTELSPLPRIYVTELSVIINNGTINLTDVFLRGGPQYPELVNNGSMNTVRISTLVGSVINNGLVNDAQLNFQFGTVNNTVTGTINDSFTLSSMGSRFINSTVFDNHGILLNTSAIDNEGEFNNWGTLDTVSGTFDNQGVVNNYCSGVILGTITGNPVNEMPCDESGWVEAGSDQTVDEGDTVLLDPATFTDAETEEIHTATIDWGDGSPVEPGVVSEFEGSGNVSGSHIYPDEGTFTVTVTVDNGSEESSDNFTVTISNVAPDVEAGPDQEIVFSENASVSAVFTDPGILDTHTASVDWGDGNEETLSVNETSGTVEGTHLYSSVGIYTVTISIVDDYGDEGSDTLQVTVNDTDPCSIIDDIAEDISDMDLPRGTENSLEVSLDNAEKKLEDNNTQNDIAAINNLKAMINKINAQKGKKIPVDEAEALIAQLQELIAELESRL